nr:MAG TPA: hypothetical protein [Caudoviricetes sp.]
MNAVTKLIVLSNRSVCQLRQSSPFEAVRWIKFAPERINNEIYEQTENP